MPRTSRAELAALRRHTSAPSARSRRCPSAPAPCRARPSSRSTPTAPIVGPLVQLASGRYPSTASDEVDLCAELAQLYGTHVGGTWGPVETLAGRGRGPGPDRPQRDLRARGPRCDRAPLDRHRAVRLDARPARDVHPAQGPLLHRSSARLSPRRRPRLQRRRVPRPRRRHVRHAVHRPHRRRRLHGDGPEADARHRHARRARRRRSRRVRAGAAAERPRRRPRGDGRSAASSGLGAWWLYAPHQQASVGHVVDPAAIAWWLVVVAMVLAPVTTTLAARRPALAISRLPSSPRCRVGQPSRRSPSATPRSARAFSRAASLVVFAGGAGARGSGGGSRRRCSRPRRASSLTSIGLFLVAQWIVAQLGRLAVTYPIAPGWPCATSRGTGRGPAPRSGRSASRCS